MNRGRFNPEMIVIARSLREMTQGDLAVAVGTTQGRISKVEHGLMPPSADLITALSRELKFPESFFFQPGHLYALPTRHHRKRKQLAKRILDRIHAEVTVRAMNLAQFLRAVELKSVHDLPEIDLDESGGKPEDLARLLRERWQIGRGPIENLVEVLELAGVVIMPCDFGAPEVDAIGMRLSGVPVMFINSALPVDRMRYTVAHELAHLVMHSLPTEDMEGEADRFAAEFLMPEADIKPQLRRVTLEVLASLKRVWRVSMASLLRRAYQLHTISAATYQRMWRIFSANGWRRREPPELDLLPEAPSTLKELIRFHQEELGYSPSHLGQVLHLFPDEFHRMYRFGGGLRLVS